MLAAVLVVTLILADLRFNKLEKSRSLLDTLATPIYWVADLPTAELYRHIAR